MLMKTMTCRTDRLKKEGRCMNTAVGQDKLPASDNKPLTACASLSVCATSYTGETVARGVFAQQDLARGTLVEIAHCILLPREEYQAHGRHTALEHYLFCGQNGDMLLALGLGSLFNHSRSPNLDYRVNSQELLINFYAARDVRGGEELTIYYGANLWFDEAADPGGSLNKLHEGMDNADEFLGALQL